MTAHRVYTYIPGDPSGRYRDAALGGWMGGWFPR
jgi:hypothetical protein